MRNLMTGCLLAAFLCAASCGCSKDNGGGEEGGQVAGVTVKPAYNKSEVLHNPLNGWVMYVSADYDPSYFDKEIYVPLLGKNVRVADYASACYIRTKWSVLNPADGQYAWKDPDSKVYKLVQKARELKLPIAFRVVVDGRDQGANTPQFVYDAGAEYAMSEPKYPDRRTRSSSATTRSSSQPSPRSSTIRNTPRSSTATASASGARATAWLTTRTTYRLSMRIRKR